jgi:peptidoglycan hydrolase-like protein with peptidoglycan-binding domain
MKQVQTRLASLGYFAGTIDGRAGGETNGAIAAFKTDHNLPPDAVLDQATLSALGSDLAHPRPIAAARANATLDDLRDDGSETIKAADDAESGLSVKAGAGALGVGVISEGVGQVKSLKDTLSDLVGGDLVSFVAAHGLLIAVGIAAAVAWYERGVIRKALDRVRQARLDDHRSFKNRGR